MPFCTRNRGSFIPNCRYTMSLGGRWHAALYRVYYAISDRWSGIFCFISCSFQLVFSFIIFFFAWAFLYHENPSFVVALWFCLGSFIAFLDFWYFLLDCSHSYESCNFRILFLSCRFEHRSGTISLCLISTPRILTVELFWNVDYILILFLLILLAHLFVCYATSYCMAHEAYCMANSSYIF